ncbi:MAG: Gfo/Idh/MocA family oxidoreductase [bacterium]
MSKRINVGVVGLGMGRGHVNNYLKCKDASLIAICDINDEKLQSCKNELNIPYAFKDCNKMFKLKELDAVSIAIPNFLHAPVSIAALRAGKHVMCEKPLAMNAKEAQEMVDVARSEGLTLMTHFNSRFFPTSQYIKKFIDTGNLGEIYFARTGWHRRRGVPWRTAGWFTDKKMAGGGPLIDLGVHRIDLAMWFMGNPKPVSVCGATYTKIAHKIAKKIGKKYDVEDLASAYIRFENDATMAVETSWASNSEKQEDGFTQVYGDKGGAVQKNIGDTYKFEAKIFKEEAGECVEIIPKSYSLPWGNAQGHFVKCLIDGKEPMATGEQGLDIMKILDAIYESSMIKKEVIINKK